VVATARKWLPGAVPMLKHAALDKDPGAALGRGKRQHIDSVVSILQFTR
jgi:hypothetical protein